MSEVVCYSKIEQGMAELRSRHEGVIVDTSTKEGLILATNGRRELREIRLSIEAIRVEEKRVYLEAGKKIDTMAKTLTDMVTPMEISYDKAIKEEEAKREAERVAKKKAEEEIIAKRIEIENQIRRENEALIQANKDRIAAEAQRAFEIEQEKLQIERAAFEAERKAAQDKIDAENAKIKAAQDLLDEEERLFQKKKQDAVDAERAFHEESQRRIDAAAHEAQERDRIAKEEKARLAEMRKVKRMNGMTLLKTFVDKHHDEQEFSEVVGYIQQWLKEKGDK